MSKRYCENGSCASKVENLNDFIDEFGILLEQRVLFSNFPDERVKMDELSNLLKGFKCQFNKIFDFKESSDSINNNNLSSNVSNATYNANQSNLSTDEMLDELKSKNRSIGEHAKSSNRDTIKDVRSSDNGKSLFTKEGFDRILDGLIRANIMMTSSLDELICAENAIKSPSDK